jgi:hypothetical protein
MHDQDNDGRFPDESPVEVRYPRSKQEEHGDRERWPWLPGTTVRPGRMVRVHRGPRAGYAARRPAGAARDGQP